MSDRGKELTVFEHLAELRRRLLWSLGALLLAAPVAWWQRERFFHWLQAPFDEACHAVFGHACELTYPSPTAGFTAYVAQTFVVSCLLALPVVLGQFWAFVAPGLYPKERRVLAPLIFGTVVCFAFGVWFCRSYVLSNTFAFLLENSAGKPQIMVGDYLGFFVRLVCAFGIIFELPIVVLGLSVAGVVDHRMLIRAFRYVIVAAFVLAAVLTPPDAASQIIFAFVLCVLYVVSIGIAWLFGRRRRSDAGPLALAVYLLLRHATSRGRLAPGNAV
jgi:sec-independent protein translocase protein TatC